MTDLLELAGLMRGIDLLVTLDSGPVHLAGGLGVPTLLLSHCAVEWRWGPSGAESVWYETVTPIPHPGDMDWDVVVNRCLELLGQRARHPAVAIS